MAKSRKVEFVISAASIKQLPSDDRPEIALIGRSNVGKSSLLNMLVGRNSIARISNTPGKTQTLNYYLVDDRFYLVDLPGYGFAKVAKSDRQKWGKLNQQYLSGRSSLRLICQLIDSRHPPTRLDRDILEWLKGLGIPVLIVLTKVDKLGQKQLHQSKQAILELMDTMQWEIPFVCTSSVSKDGRNDVWKWFQTYTG